jgi:hypothetical protein
LCQDDFAKNVIFFTWMLPERTMPTFWHQRVFAGMSFQPDQQLVPLGGEVMRAPFDVCLFREEVVPRNAHIYLLLKIA